MTTGEVLKTIDAWIYCGAERLVQTWSDVLRSILHVEVLDPQVCLYNSSVPHGLMKLKLRLLEAIGNKVLLVWVIVEFQLVEVGLTTETLRKRMNGRRHDTKIKNPEKPVLAHASTHSLNFEDCYTIKLIVIPALEMSQEVLAAGVAATIVILRCRKKRKRREFWSLDKSRSLSTRILSESVKISHFHSMKDHSYEINTFGNIDDDDDYIGQIQRLLGQREN
uniref:Uncharacterized protein n=1 Tax=Timema poppense TaxID=170557 RepID=A0A7R9DED6_TIMPO|nr:unnamed protein product [Timema poppensis]